MVLSIVKLEVLSKSSESFLNNQFAGTRLDCLNQSIFIALELGNL